MSARSFLSAAGPRMSFVNETDRPRAVLVAVQLPHVTDDEVESSLDELQRLVETLGLTPIARVSQKRRGVGSAAVFGEGKLKEIARLTGGTGVVPAGVTRRPGKKTRRPGDAESDDEEDLDVTPTDEVGLQDAPDELATVVVVDDDLTPTQLRNLEGATSAEVHDRSSVILSIFQRHARTREALLQVEIARLVYMAPRLRLAGGGGDRQRGGVGGKGAGESSLELDRRRVRDRIAALRRELEVVQRDSSARRTRRVDSRAVAIVGYTNAGKSSLMRRLTETQVLVENKLFATLDTTVRSLCPETRPKILVSDTVGFIKKLPHDLVASFRSTLEEASQASFLLHVVDASDPAFRSHIEVTETVLGEVGAGERESLLVLNKMDCVDAEERAALTDEFPDAMQISALAPEDVDRTHAAIVQFFERDMVEGELFVSYAEPRRIHEIHEACRVLSETHEEQGTRVLVRAPAGVLERLRSGGEHEDVLR